MPIGGSSNKAQRAVVEKKAKSGGGEMTEEEKAFKAKQVQRISKSITFAFLQKCKKMYVAASIRPRNMKMFHFQTRNRKQAAEKKAVAAAAAGIKGKKK